MAEIDVSDVRINPVSLGEGHLKAEVTTPYGVARVTLDLSSDDIVGVRAVLPSGNVYQSIVESWASDAGDFETEVGISSTLRLAAIFIVKCFQEEAARVD
jgi:hypothetical protein